MTFIDSRLGPLIEYEEPSSFEYSSLLIKENLENWCESLYQIIGLRTQICVFYTSRWQIPAHPSVPPNAKYDIWIRTKREEEEWQGRQGWNLPKKLRKVTTSSKLLSLLKPSQYIVCQDY